MIGLSSRIKWEKIALISASACASVAINVGLNSPLFSFYVFEKFKVQLIVRLIKYIVVGCRYIGFHMQVMINKWHKGKICVSKTGYIMDGMKFDNYTKFGQFFVSFRVLLCSRKSLIIIVISLVSQFLVSA